MKTDQKVGVQLAFFVKSTLTSEILLHTLKCQLNKSKPDSVLVHKNHYVGGFDSVELRWSFLPYTKILVQEILDEVTASSELKEEELLSYSVYNMEDL